MTLLLMLLVIVVVAAVAAVATGRITGAMDDPVSSLPARPLTDDAEIGPVDVQRVRFSPALRGYRMEEVDRTLDRLVLELARRDEVIADLRGRLGQDGEDDVTAGVHAPAGGGAGRDGTPSGTQSGLPSGPLVGGAPPPPPPPLPPVPES